jgi:hypothetical protein
MSVTVSAGVVALAVVCAGWLVARELRARRRDTLLVQLTSTFAPAISQAMTGARRLFPDAFRELDAANDGRFPFTPALIEAAHAKWTTEWLAWERQHDLEYKARASVEEAALDAADEAAVQSARVRLAALEQEKLQTYQQRYEEYVRVGKAIAALEDGVGR